jgi:hypothetical protein
VGLRLPDLGAADERGLRVPVALAAAIADGLGALVTSAWLVSGRLDGVGGLGAALLTSSRSCSLCSPR